jgi:hypothetical protein
MLLDLLEHHEDLFLAVIGRFIGQNMRVLAALSTVNRRLNGIVSSLCWPKHAQKLHHSLSLIKTINILQNKYVSLREFNGCVTVYSCWEISRYTGDFSEMHDPVHYYIYNTSRSFHNLLIHGETIISRRINIYDCGFTIIINGNIPEWIKHYNVFTINQQTHLENYIFNN